MDSPKCPRCSLLPICLPDETAALQEEDPSPIREVRPSTDDRRPLYVQSQGARVSKSGERLVVTTKDGERAEVRLLDVSQLCLFGGVSVTTGAVKELAKRSIPIAYFSTGGWFYALTHGHGSKNALLRIAQFAVASDPDRALDIARGMVGRKLRNQRTQLMRNAQNVTASVRQQIKNAADRVVSAESRDELLGLEGLGAKLYFESFEQMLKPMDVDAFSFHARNRRPPRDPINALLSMAYATLAKDWTVSLMSVGLDPYVGVLHQPRHGRPSLALDLMEEFRPLVADSVVLQLVNNAEIKSTHFVRAGGRCGLTAEGRKRFYSAYDRRMSHEVTHPTFGYKVSYRQLFEIQARLFAKALTGEVADYGGFQTR